jgi:hypothetical protein
MSNNIYGNSVIEGSDYVDPGLVKTQSSSYGTVSSASWGPDNGAVVQYARLAYSESDSYSDYYSGYLKGTSGSTATLWSGSSSWGPKLIDLTSFGATAMKVEVKSNTSSNGYSGTVTISGALFYRDASGGFEKELAAVTNSGQVDCTDNYWGLGLPEELSTLPDKLTLSRPDAIDYSSQVGTEKSGTGPQ